MSYIYFSIFLKLISEKKVKAAVYLPNQKGKTKYSIPFIVL